MKEFESLEQGHEDSVLDLEEDALAESVANALQSKTKAEAESVKSMNRGRGGMQSALVQRDQRDIGEETPEEGRRKDKGDLGHSQVAEVGANETVPSVLCIRAQTKGSAQEKLTCAKDKIDLCINCGEGAPNRDGKMPKAQREAALEEARRKN